MISSYFWRCTLLIIVLVVVAARSAPSCKSPVNYRLCQEEYRKLRRRQDEASAELSDDNGDYVDEGRESICEQAMDMIIQHRDISKLNPSIFLHYCPHYDERLALVQENNNTLHEEKKQEQNREGYDDSIDGDKRYALRKRELKKRSALRFIRKRMSSNF